MKIIYKLIQAFIGVILLFFFAGCKKFVEIEPPTTQTVTTNLFNNSTSATAAQTAIYSQMSIAGDSWLISQSLSLLGDELKNYSTAARIVQYYENALIANTNYGLWTDGYNYIYQANAIIQGLEDNSGIPAVIQNQLICLLLNVRQNFLIK